MKRVWFRSQQVSQVCHELASLLGGCHLQRGLLPLLHDHQNAGGGADGVVHHSTQPRWL